MKLKVIVKEYPAMGGPKTSGIDAAGFEQGPTDAGTYRVHQWGRHTSKRYPAWGGVVWGTPLRKDKETKALQIQVEGKWQELAKFSPVSEEDIKEKYLSLYDTRRIPDAWVFNDFGHRTIYLYRDLNNSGKFDGVEKQHAEFIHTTPDNEAESAKGTPVSLFESHGCVHVRPHDIDELVRLRYVTRNSLVVVHTYAENRTEFKTGIKPGPPYELHIYPGIHRMYVIGPEQA